MNKTVTVGIVARRGEDGKFLPAKPITRDTDGGTEEYPKALDWFAWSIAKVLNERHDKEFAERVNKRRKELGL